MILPEYVACRWGSRHIRHAKYTVLVLGSNPRNTTTYARKRTHQSAGFSDNQRLIYRQSANERKKLLETIVDNSFQKHSVHLAICIRFSATVCQSLRPKGLRHSLVQDTACLFQVFSENASFPKITLALCKRFFTLVVFYHVNALP